MFERAGVTDRSQQGVIMNEKLKDLYITHEVTEFVHVEKEIPVSRSELSELSDILNM